VPQSAAQKGNPFLWSGTPFCVLKAVRPSGNNIGETPDAFAWRARVVLPVLQHRITGWLFNSHSFQIYKM